MKNKALEKKLKDQIKVEGDHLVYKVTIEKPFPQILIASEDKLKEWLGFRMFEKLKIEGKIEQLKMEEESE